MTLLGVLGFPQFTLFFNRIYIRKLRHTGFNFAMVIAHHPSMKPGSLYSEPLYQLSYQGINRNTKSKSDGKV